MTERGRGARVVAAHRPAGGACPRSTRTHVERALARPGRARGAGPARRRLRARRPAASRAGRPWARSGLFNGADARAAHPRRGRHRHRGRVAGPASRCTTPGSSASSATLADALQRSMLTEPPRAGPLRDRRPLRAGRGRAPRSAATGTTRSCSPTARPCSRSVTSSATTPAPPRRWARCAGCCAASATPAAASPAEVLSRAGPRPSQGLGLDTMATALVARLEQDDAGPARGHGRLRWASAGHPPPVLLARRRRGHAARRRAADLLLGVAPDAAAHGPRVAWTAGATVLLYTDGLVERRDRDIDAGTAELRPACSASCAELPLEELCDRRAGAAVPARRRGRRRAARRPAASAGPARPRRRAAAVPPGIAPAPTSPRRRTEAELSARAAGVGRAGCGRERQVDGDRRLPAAPHRQQPQPGDSDDHHGGDRQRGAARAVRRGCVSAGAPIRAATAL